MRAVRSWVSGIVLITGSVALPLQGTGQQEASDRRSHPRGEGGRARSAGPHPAAPSGAGRGEPRHGRQGPAERDRQRQGRLQPQVRRREVHPEDPRLSACGRTVLPQRRCQGDPQQRSPPPRAADHRGDRRQVLRLPRHARLRPGHRRSCSTPTGKGSSTPRSPCGPASSSRRSDSSGCSRPPTSPSPSAASRPTSSRAATSASRSAATCPRACSPIRSACSTAFPTSATATAT